MNLYALPPLLTSFLTLAYGVFILLRNRRSWVNISFFLTCASIAIWMFSSSMCYMAGDEELANRWLKNSYVGIALVPAAIYHFTITFLEMKHKKRRALIIYANSIVYIFVARLGYFNNGVSPYFFGYFPKASLAQTMFIIFFISVIVLCIHYLGKESRAAEAGSIRQARIRYMFWSMTIGSLGGLDFLPSYGLKFYPFGFSFILAFIVISGYAIVKYRLLDIETFLHRTVGYVAISSVFIVLYSAAFAALHELLLKKVPIPSFWVTGALLVVFLWIFIPVKSWLWSLIDRFFYRDKYKYREVLGTFIKKLNMIMDLDELLPMIVDTISETIRPDRASVMILDEAGGEYVVKSQRGMANPGVTLGRDDSFATWLFSQRKLIEKEQLASDPWYSKMQDVGDEKFGQLEAEICIPLIARNHMVGILNLGRKESGEPYKKEDIELLSDLGAQSSIAINNALSYNLLKKRTEQLHLLSKLGQEMGQTLELNQIGKNLIEKIKELMHAEIVAILLRDEHTGELTVTVSLGLDEQSAAETRIKAGEKISGWVAQLGQPVIIDDIEADSRLSKRAQERYYTKSLMSSPLMVKGKVIGVINVNNSQKKKAFNSYDLEVFSGICSEASAIIENARLYSSLRQSYLRTLQSLAEALDAKDQYTCGHCSRVREYAMNIARHMGLSDQSIDSIATAAVLHDIGKIGISESILSKPSRLTKAEYEEIKKHPEMSEKIVKPIGLPENTLQIIKYHHERYGGHGYPNGLEKDKIPVGARILNLADAYDAMTSDRPYRKALSKDQAIEEMRRCASDQFDPDIVDVFTGILEKEETK